MVRELIQAGADVNLATNSGVLMTSQEGHADVLALLLKKSNKGRAAVPCGVAQPVPGAW